MKKISALIMLLLSAALLVIPTYAADEDLVDLYPYDDPGALLGPSTIHTLVGDSNWDVLFSGHRYHVVRGGVRYAKDFEDKDANGYIGALEMGALSWNAFASVIINDTEDEIILETTNARTDLTTVVHRMYAYFDADGKLMMFEDHINTYAIINDGTVEETDYRLATEEEIAADAAKPDEEKEVAYKHVRLAVSDTDTDGYVLEPLGYLTWTNPELASKPVEEQSLILTENPNYVTIPAGYTVWSFGTNDRGTQNAKTTALIKTFPGLIADKYEGRMELVYDTQAPLFAGVNLMDDDAVTPGINKVVEFNGSFSLPSNISVSYVQMFDEAGKIVNQVVKLPYTVDIVKDGEVLETIEYTYDAETDAYTASAEVTKVDSSIFGAGYQAIFKATHPLNKTTEIAVDVVIGVMPPKFKNVENRFAKEDQFIDLLGIITADDGYGNDKTSDIIITAPESLNVYYPQPGEYTINLEFTHHVHIAGTPSYPAKVTFGGNSYDITKTNEQIATLQTEVALWTDPATFKTSTFSWGSAGVFIEVNGEGKVIRTINRRTWDLVDENGKNTPANAQSMFDGWLANLTFEEGGFLVSVGASAASYAAAGTIVFNDEVSISEAVIGIPDFDTDIVTKTSYNLTITDHTAPTVLVVNDKYTVSSADFTTVNEAILANIVAFDNYDENLSVYVAANGGMNLSKPGEYTVSVEAVDGNGNSTTVSFKVKVVEPTGLTQEDLDNVIAELNDKIAELEGKLLTEDQVLALIQEKLNEYTPVDTNSGKVGVGATVGISVGSALASFGGAFLLFRRK